MKLAPIRSIACSFAFATVVVGSLSMPFVGGVGCTPKQAEDAHNVLDQALSVTQLGCIMGGLGNVLTNSEAIAKVCEIAPKLLPVISDLVGVRDAAKKSGVAWKGPGSAADAGATEAGASR